MNEKKISVFFVKTLPRFLLFALGFAGVNLIGCGADETETEADTKRLTSEEQKDIARFVEYVFFPTSPYVDKSWIESVPAEEVVKKPIDFPTETAAIQQVYIEVYEAWEARDFERVAAYFYPSTIRIVFLCDGGDFAAIVGERFRAIPRLLLSKTSLRNPYNVCNGGFFPLSSTPRLTEFYIRRQNVQAPFPEVSAKTADDTYIYLTKRGDRWYMNELVVTTYDGSTYTDKGDTRKYFDDPKYKAPE